MLELRQTNSPSMGRIQEKKRKRRKLERSPRRAGLGKILLQINVPGTCRPNRYSSTIQESMKFIIEHLDSELYEWSLAEYEHIIKVLGRETVLFTNIKDCSKLKFAECGEKSVIGMNLQKACVLDPEAEQTLEPSDKEKFEYFIFGGILGNNPPEKRTAELLSSKLNFEKRNLGKKQMSTDTAVIVSWKILNGKKFNELNFVDDPEIKIEEGLNTVMPYRYLADEKGKPIICEKVLELIKKGW